MEKEEERSIKRNRVSKKKTRGGRINGEKKENNAKWSTLGREWRCGKKRNKRVAENSVLIRGQRKGDDIKASGHTISEGNWVEGGWREERGRKLTTKITLLNCAGGVKGVKGW